MDAKYVSYVSSIKWCTSDHVSSSKRLFYLNHLHCSKWSRVVSINQYQSDVFSSVWARLNVVHTHESALLFDVILIYSNPLKYTLYPFVKLLSQYCYCNIYCTLWQLNIIPQSPAYYFKVEFASNPVDWLWKRKKSCKGKA